MEYTIKKSRRAKRLRIVVSADQVQVVTPYGVNSKLIEAFVAEKSGWIQATKKKLKAKFTQQSSFFPHVITENSLIPISGHQFSVCLKNSQSNQIICRFEEPFFVFEKPFGEMTDSDKGQSEMREALIKCLIKLAKVEVLNYVEQYVSLSSLQPKSVTIKEQKSRWGSCGIHNDIYINWRLVMAPARVMEYVVVHELCHIQERNHSSAFWRLVAQYMPDYQAQRAWLKHNGFLLMK